MSEVVYILINEYMPDLVKIGRTDKSIKERIRELSSTSVPVPFECFYACEVEDARKVEKGLHQGLGDHRVHDRREFFKINPERVKAILELFELRNVTTKEGEVVEDIADQNALNKARSRRPNFRFDMVDIQVGAELKFLRNEDVTCKVVGDKKVEFEGQEFFLSKLTLDILEKQFDEKPPAVRGPDYWLYEGETLNERRFGMGDEDG